MQIVASPAVRGSVVRAVDVVVVPPPARRRAADIATVLVFLAGLGVPLGGFLANPAGRPTTENRPLAARPRLVPERWAVTTFPPMFEAYFNDRVGFRPELLAARRAVIDDALDDTTAGTVWIGRDGWLFMNSSGLPTPLPTRLADPSDRIAGWADVLRARHRYLKSRGIEYVVVVARDKDRVYPEHLPAARRRHPIPDLLPELRDRLGPDGPTVIDPLPALLAGKADGPMYFRLDSHWTDAGAVLGWQPVRAELARRFPGYQPRTAADYTPVPLVKPQTDLAKALGRPEERQREPFRMFGQPPPHFQPTDALAAAVTASGTDWHRNLPPTACATPAATGPRLLLLHDSYGVDIARLTAADYVRFTGVGTCGLPVPVLDLERPQVVVQLFVERRLRTDKPPPALDGGR